MNQHTKISLLLLTHNSKADLEQYFSWVKKSRTINEIIVIDDKSQDSCEPFFKKNKNEKQSLIFRSHHLLDFSSQRNYALQFCKNEWVLWLDPDEELSENFVKFIDNFTAKEDVSAYSFIRREFFLKHLLANGPTTHDFTTRLFNKYSGSFVGSVHEIWNTKEKVEKRYEVFFHHSNHNISQFLNKINFYSSLRSKELFDKKVKVTIFDIFFYPLAKFLEIYFLHLGILDGIYGTIFAFGISFHSFLVRSKLWHLYSQSVG